MKKYDSVTVAKYMMAIANSIDIVLNVTKVQKLLFIVYGYFLAKHDRIIMSESPKAWPYGPVFPRARKKVDYSKIIRLDNPDISEVKEDAELTSFLEQILKDFGEMSALALTEWSHTKDSPWDKTTKLPDFKWNREIPDDFIREYFITFLNGAKN